MRTIVAVALLGAFLGAIPGAAQQESAPSGVAPAAPVEREEAALVLSQSEAQLAELAASGPTVVFFFAAWCPLCQAAIKEFGERWGEVRPEVTLVIADYDTEAALKTRYGITYQDTFVQVGPDLSAIRIWNGGAIEALNANTVFAGF
jgi:thiol-disulfide isomerase/thioredoxin